MLRKRLFAGSTLVLLSCQLTFAQYGGPMAPTPAPGTPGYTPPSGGYSSNKAAIGAGIGAGAAGGALFLALRHRGVHKGCVGPDGNSLTDKSGHRFQLQGSSLKPGEEVSVKTKKVRDDSNGSTLEVVDLKKDLGPCEEQRASR